MPEGRAERSFSVFSFLAVGSVTRITGGALGPLDWGTGTLGVVGLERS